MMSETVSISKERYEELLECERFRDKRRFSKGFIEEIRESEQAYEKGECVTAKDGKETKRIFDSL